MVIVYANSKDRAIRLATALDGVYIMHEKIRVRIASLNQWLPALESEFDKEGILHSYYRGETFNFVYSSPDSFVPYKMNEYDPEYSNAENRPVPFFPDMIRYKCVDEALKRRLHIYTAAMQQASIIINAATDDVEGDISFLQFVDNTIGLDTLNSRSKDKSFLRAHPRSMTEFGVREAFNSLKAINDSETASVLASEFAWLFSCNISNAITRYSYNKLFAVSGRVESIMLLLIAERANLIKNEKKYPRFNMYAILKPKADTGRFHPFTIKLEPSSGTGGDFTEEESAATQKEFNTYIENKTEFKVVSADRIYNEDGFELLNAYQAQLAIMRLGYEMKDAVDALQWLFNNGYITAPNASTKMPWAEKSKYTNNLAMLANTGDYSSKIMPHDIDKYLDWYTSDGTDELQSGIFVTEQQFPFEDTSLPQIYADAYRVIADSIIQVVQKKKISETRRIMLTNGSRNLMYLRTKNTIGDAPRQGTLGESTDLQTAGAYIIDSIKISPVKPHRAFTELSLFDELIRLYDGVYVYSPTLFYNAFRNVYGWKQVEKDGDGILRQTGFGLALYRYFALTMLNDVSGNIDWDRKILLVANNRADFSSIYYQYSMYLKDCCFEIGLAGEEIAEFRGGTSLDMRCPRCGSLVSYEKLEDDKPGRWKCNRCEFSFSEEQYSHKLTRAEVYSLLVMGKTDTISDFVSTKGPYSARLKLNGAEIERDFSFPAKCPICGGELATYAKSVRCKNQSCGFSISKQIRGCELTDDDIVAILNRSKTRVLDFVSSAGKQFKAQLTLDNSNKISFIFQNK